MQSLLAVSGTQLAMLVAMLLSGVLVGYTGFGFNLLATPMLALIIPPKDAVVVGLLIGGVVNGVMALAGARMIQGRNLGFLLLASLPGLLLGGYLFTTISAGVLKPVIGILTVLSAIVLGLWRRKPVPMPANNGPDISPDNSPANRSRMLVTVGAGFLSGVLTETTGMGGPPIVLRLMLEPSDPRRIRATLTAYTAVSSLAAVALLLVTRQAGPAGFGYGALLIPIGVVGLAIGVMAFRRHPAHYRKLVIATLVFVGANGAVVALT